jgi:sugar fermentation stimulation protein A
VRFRPLIKGRLLRRYKRFLADVVLDSGETVTAHTANPGAMRGLTLPDRVVYLSQHDNPKRKLKYSWELVRIGRHTVGVNPMHSNTLVAEALAQDHLEPLRGYQSVRREVRYGSRGSRIDLLLEGTHGRCYLEVKTATYMQGHTALFPDAVTERGRKHLLELADVVAAGDRGVVCFVAQRCDVHEVAPADAIDPAYGRTLREVMARGVELYAYRSRVRVRSIQLSDRVPVTVGRA